MSLVETQHRDGAIWLWLSRPERHNALIQPLLDDLRAAIACAAEADPVALIISGHGPSFSTGGDISGFLDAATSHDDLQAYADRLVGTLHDIILDLLAFPAPVLAAVNGPVTGGSVGLMLAADLVAMADHAFLQPYYSEVGFAPDGGWTALLPEKIGTSRSLQIQYLNDRIPAAEALAFGLVASVVSASQLDTQITSWVGSISRRSAQTHKATRANIWDEVRRMRVRQGLDLEKQRFLELITRPETLTGMTTFTQRRA